MEPAVRWLLTYLVHSTLLLGAAFLARVALRERRLTLQEALLRAALVGGFVTASLQVGLDLHPLGGSLAVPAAHPAASVPPAPAVAIASMAAADDGQGWPPDGSLADASTAPAWVDRAVSAAAESWKAALALAWGALGLLALARLAVAALRLRRLLRGRRTIDGDDLAPAAALVGRALGLSRPVRLSAAPRLSAPLATGVLRPEVCLPTRAMAELAVEERLALCAHELAHVARRDPAWILLARLAEAAAPLQPLNAWARRRLQDVAECLSDDLAVTASGRPLGLARSLVDVASWTLGERSLIPAAAVGALSAGSRLGHRVERLMDPTRALERPRRILLPAAVIAVLATALVTPVVSGTATPQDPPSAPEAPPPPPPAPQAQPAPPAPPALEAPPMPEAPPAPDPQPAPKARPAAPPHPVAAPHPAPKAAAADTQERLEQLSRQIAERTRLHEGEMKKLEAEIEALAAKIQPDQAEMERASQEIQKAAEELAEAASEDVAAGAGKSERTAEAARRMAEAKERLHAAARDIRIPHEEMRALAEKARALAEQARPTAAEMHEIGRLAAEAARLSAEQVREAMRAAAEALRQAHEELRRAQEKPRE
jgi:beta-lactamase regulating signal transducer with metallopeptidase domain